MSTTRKLYYGDNLKVLREHVETESVDLIYLDPPFNSQVDYNVIFKGQDSKGDLAQTTAFTDTWSWGPDDEQILFELTQKNGVLAQFLSETVTRLERNSLAAYLVMMAVRLIELHRVLKDTGSLYLHVDSSASHYIKVVLDIIFGPQNFRNEIIWKGADAHNDAKKQFAGITDRILFYSKDYRKTFFQPQYTDFPEKTLREWYLTLELPDGTTRRMTRQEIDTQQIPEGARRFNAGDMASPQPRPNLMFAYKGYPHPPKGWRYSPEKMAELDAAGLLLFPKDAGGRIMRKRYLDEAHGPVMPDLWADIPQLRGHDLEKLGYPTQKPVALLERIVKASSKPGDVVLDPFCGCGTTISAAEKLGRSWVGIDITHLSVSLIKARLRRDFGLLPTEYTEEGTPTTVEAAKYLFDTDPFEFQFWILGEIAAQPYGANSGSKKGKKGADGGIDGQMFFMRPDGGKVEKVIVSVKGGKNLTAGMVRDLAGVLTKENAAIGVFICLAPPTAGVLKEAAQQGGYEYAGKLFPRVQVLTVEEILQGKQPNIPTGAVNVSYEQKQVKNLQTEAAKKNMQTLF